MKTYLRNFLALCSLILLSSVAFGQAPTIAYTPTTNSYTINTLITPLAPSTSIGVTGAFAATTTFYNGVNGTTFGVITYDAFSGNFFAVANSNLYRITPAGVATQINTTTLSNTNSGTGIITDAAGNIYVSQTSNGRVYEFNNAGSTTLVRTITGFTTPDGLALDASGNLYVADGGTNSIYEVAPGVSTAGTAILTGLTGIYGIAINSAGDLYGTQNGGSNATRLIFKVANIVSTPRTKTTFVAGGSGFTGPRGLTFDSLGDLFLADGTTIKMISTTAAVTTLTAVTGLGTPGQVDFDLSGNLYIADAGRTIKESAVTYYTLTGTIPPGLTFDYTSGTFNGTPTTLGTYNNVMVAAKNNSGTSTAVTLTFVIKAHPPILAFTPNAYTFVNGTGITPFSIANTGDPIVGNYSITGGTLPAGLIFTASTGTISGTPTAVTAGAVAITVSGTNTGGTVSATVNITVNNPPPPIITYTNNDVYVNGTTISPNLSPNASAGGPVASYSAPTLPAGLSIDPVTGIISGTPTATSPATGYLVTATNPGGSGTFTITITVNNPPVPNFTYTNPPAITYGSAIAAVTPANSGNASTSCTISPTGTGIVVSATGVVSGTPTAVGTQIYTITPSNAGGTGSAATVTITVNPKALTVTANAQTKVYGAALPTLTVTYNGFIAGESATNLTTQPTITTTATTSSPVSPPTYPITASGAVDPNYTITYVAGALTVTKAALNVKANAQTKNYGTVFTFAGTEFTTTGLQPGDAVSSATFASPGTVATATVAGSPYTITPSAAAGTGLANYTITYTTNTLTVNKVTLTVTANNISKTYGSTYTFAGTELTTSGLLNTDKVTGATITSTGAVATATVAGSPYPIVINTATGTGLTNYNITYVNGAMTVTPAAITITAVSQTRDVGIVIAPLSVTYTGLQNGATTTATPPTISTTATIASGPGTYPITASGAADPNYTISYVAGVLTITAAGTHTYTWDWTGAASTTWETPANWDIGGVPQTTNYPGSATNKDIADIGVNILYNSTKSPVITGATVSIASIAFGTDNAVNVGLTVNGTLTVSSDITLTVDNNIFGNALNINLSGTGTINVPNLNVINNQTALAFETSSINSSVANLNVAGNITLTTGAFILANIGSKFTVTGGTTTVGGVLTTVNSPGFFAATTSTFSVYPTTTATLNLANANAMHLDNSTSVIDFDHAGSTVNYTGTSASQTVYTTPTTNATGGVPYGNLTISGTGTGVPAAGTLTVDLNMVTSGTTDFSVNAPTVNVAGNWTNTANVTQGGSNITVSAQLINTSNTITGGSGFLTANSMEFNGGTLVAGAGTVTSAGNYQNDSGTFNCGTAANASVIFGYNYTNNGGIFIANPTSTSKVTFTGSAPTLVDKTTAGTTFNNVNFNTTNAAISNNTGNFAVAGTGTLTMGAAAKLTAGSTTVGYLTLLSNSSSTASVAAIPSSSVIIGDINVQRFITGGLGTRGYRLLTTPVNISTNYSGGGNLGLSYLNTNASFGGTTYLGAFTEGPGTGFTYNGSFNPIIYLYDESRATNNSAYTAGKNIGIYTINASNTVYTLTSGVVSTSPVSIPVGNSYLFYYVGDNHDATQGAVVATRQPESISITATGYLNQQNVPVKFWNTGSTNIPYDVTSGTSYPGLNQVGNPYASTISLDVVATDNTAVNKVFWELVPGGSYVAYSAATHNPVSDSRASKYIVSGQGFLVEAQATGETLTFQEHEKVAYPTGFASPFNTATGQALLLSIPSKPGLNTNDVAALNADAPLNAAVPQANAVSQATPAFGGLHMQLTKDSLNYVQTGIYFNNNNSSDKYVVNEDATSVNGSALVYLSSYSSDNVNLGINQLGDYAKGKRVRLYAGVSSSGSYTISLADITNIDTVNYRVYLIDNKMNDSLDMVHYKSYAFTINNSDTTTYGANRFILAIERIALPPYKLISFAGQKVSNGVMLTWQTLNEGTYTVFALQKLVGNSYNTLYTIQGTGAGDYGYVDTHPVNGNNTYRLQQTDINGNITYTLPITINYNSKAPNGNLTIYPNPAKSMITISLSTNTTAASYVADIYNTSGTVVSHKVVNADTWTQDISSYKLGVYIIEIKSNSGDLIGKSKFVKIF